MRFTFKFWMGIALCAGTSVMLCVLLRDGEDFRLEAPAISLLAVILTSVWSGRRSALIGSIMATFTYEFLLFPPIGSLVIERSDRTDDADRVPVFRPACSLLVTAQFSPQSDGEIPVAPARILSSNYPADPLYAGYLRDRMSIAPGYQGQPTPLFQAMIPSPPHAFRSPLRRIFPRNHGALSVNI